MGKGNGEMVDGIYHCFMEGFFDFVDTTALWKELDLHRNGIYAILSEEGKKAILIYSAMYSENKFRGGKAGHVWPRLLSRRLPEVKPLLRVGELESKSDYEK